MKPNLDLAPKWATEVFWKEDSSVVNYFFGNETHYLMVHVRYGAHLVSAYRELHSEVSKEILEGPGWIRKPLYFNLENV